MLPPLFLLRFHVSVQSGDELLTAFEVGNMKIRRIFKQDNTLKGTVALHPTFDLGLDVVTGYRFEKVNFMRVSNQL